MDAAGGTRNITLTGPNAGGKSTFLMGMTTSLLLSQTFGIAPAKEAKLTPFDKINTSINIMDDIAAGKSLFMAVHKSISRESKKWGEACNFWRTSVSGHCQNRLTFGDDGLHCADVTHRICTVKLCAEIGIQFSFCRPSRTSTLVCQKLAYNEKLEICSNTLT